MSTKTPENGELIEEIREMVEGDDMTLKSAMRLMLVSQRRILEGQARVQERLAQLEATLKQYPSLLYLWAHRRRDLILALVALVIILSAISPLVRLDTLARALAGLLGLPAP